MHCAMTLPQTQRHHHKNWETEALDNLSLEEKKRMTAHQLKKATVLRGQTTFKDTLWSLDFQSLHVFLCHCHRAMVLFSHCFLALYAVTTSKAALTSIGWSPWDSGVGMMYFCRKLKLAPLWLPLWDYLIGFWIITENNLCDKHEFLILPGSVHEDNLHTLNATL